jgi:hypothetical protein
LRARSTNEAAFVRSANLAEIDAYVRLFPSVKLILIRRRQAGWLALPAHRGDSRFEIRGPVALWLSEDSLQRFDTVLAAFDGRLFWYRGRDPTQDPSISAYLREQIIRQDDKGLPPPTDTLQKKGLSAEERAGYGYAWKALVEEKRDRNELRLRDALAHAGADLRDYSEREDMYVVRYEINGRTHVSTVRQDDLTVMTAGICLAGQDRYFDLTSLVGVLREAQEQQMVWVGDGALPEQQYWQIHPPENP